MKEKAIKRSYVKTQTGDRIFAFALLLPAIITTAAFILIPVADSIYRSFFDYKVKNIISGKPGVWNDFANYIKLFSNGKLVPSMMFPSASFPVSNAASLNLPNTSLSPDQL